MATREHDEHDHYVSLGNWNRTTGRDDLIDEIADQFERRQAGARRPVHPARPLPRAS